MPDICLLGDTCTGHQGFSPRPNAESDSYMTVNGRAVHCEGHAWEKHCNSGGCHDGILAAGSAYYTVNGNPVGRVGDPVDCGSKVATGDPYFVIND